MNAESRTIMASVEEKLVEIEKLEVKKERLKKLKSYYVYKEEGRECCMGKISIRAIDSMVGIYEEKICNIKQFITKILRGVTEDE